MSNPRRANGTRRTALLRRMRAEGAPCWICRMPIDYGIAHGDPLAFECDELKPVSRGGSPFDLENTAPAHACCNNWRGDKSEQLTRAIADAVLSQAPLSSPLEFVRAAKMFEKGRMTMPFISPAQTTTDW